MNRSRARLPRGDGPEGGVHAGPARLIRWRWTRSGSLVSQPIRCKREQWYLVRARARGATGSACSELLTQFLGEDQTTAPRHLRLLPADGTVASTAPGSAESELLGWVQASPEARHLRVNLTDDGAARLERLTFHPIAEHAPTCHPGANVPRWSAYRPAFPIATVWLPESLASLGAILGEVRVRWLRPVRSLKSLAAQVRGSACVLDPQWPRRLGWSLRELESLASQCRLMVDLETLARALRQARRASTEVLTCRSRHDVMAARVTCAAVETRGFALEDVLPLSILAPGGGFATRALRATRSWTRYASGAGFAPLLASETPWASRCHDVLSAARPIGSGTLIAADLPWLVAGVHGPLLAPRLATHLLRMHLARPLDDAVRYWNRWQDERIVLRDLAELARRYPPVQAVRWAARDGLARVGLCVRGPGEGPLRRHLMICTGRVDQEAAHDGAAPEAMSIFLQWLAREVRENTAWAQRLAGAAVTWQFDAAAGLRYVPAYTSAAALGTPPPTAVLSLADAGPGAPTSSSLRPPSRTPEQPETTRLRLDLDPGICGDRSLVVQEELTQRVRGWIERAAAVQSS
jgi:hypothetical protein